MNKNNFFVKFAVLYRANIASVKEHFFYAVNELIEAGRFLLSFFIALFLLIVTTICLIFPVLELAVSFTFRYVDKDEADELKICEGYKYKSLLKKKKAELEKEGKNK